LVLTLEAFLGLVEVAHESGAPQLAVGEDPEAGILLPLQHREDATILDRRELRGRRRAVDASVEQFARPQQAADVIRTVGWRHLANPPEIRHHTGRSGGYSSNNRAGLVTAMVRTSAAVKPASSSRCANIANPSATGGLIVWPRSVEITARDTPAFR